MDKAREIAIQILNEVHEEGAYANVALARHLRRTELSDQDRRFVTELVYGAVKAGDTLDWILRRYVNRPLKKIPPMVREILRLGLYQIFYLDKVPASAACNTAVELTKKYSHAGTVKFVNAVLRTAVREPEKASFPEGKGRATEGLALKSQHPYWLVKRWVKQFGFAEAEALCAFDNGQPVLSLRTNTLKTTRPQLMTALQEAGAEVEESRWAPEGLRVTAHGALDNLAPLQEGLCQVQDESSMLVAHVVDPQPGELIIDCCSAPGGKTTHMAALMKNQGRIVAGDIYEHKLERIAENAQRLGIAIIEPTLLDAREVGEEYEAMADRVLVDAPCSGLGVLRRKPDARWNKRPEELAALPPLQGEILDSAARALKAGGVLVYSTCTIDAAENDEVVESFLTRHPEFTLEQTGYFLPQKRETMMVQLYPQRDGTDGFFIARLRKAKG
ncbi:MAG: 16S rRNA (cytosine(967)-C(5))-methyltransferase RsmB [Selenomonas sp.]|uniref:16S rRNA (cytosine(967)-C(5))-methyltransferase RsmB n=1 Tax=Selenomonas sp. TaxID=2053611 RepID=UPI0025F29D74|nr:16S rRNA (cytosine(967)-C(5))-methyltransferase RsmB [Selenomonas sp.]MCR5758542.1 16S rRNA (cytosine(967)-C(5))-methyltransferase RsmB [Selenomonas sp.]